MFSAETTDRVSTTIAPAVAFSVRATKLAPAPVAVAPPPSVAESTPKKARRVSLSSGPYLPVTGSLPLRFASARDWPQPLPGPASALSEDSTAVASNVSEASPAPAEVTPANPSLPVPQSVAVTNEPTIAPAAASPEPTMLTADMVLGFLGQMPTVDVGRIAVRFEPAIPQRTSSASALATLSP